MDGLLPISSATAVKNLKSTGIVTGDMGRLSPHQEAQLTSHSKHHSKEHMKIMKMNMRSGMSFGKAHDIAQSNGK